MQKRSHIEMLADAMKGLNAMIDATSQMVHQFQNPKAMWLRDLLQLVSKDFQKGITLNPKTKDG